MRTGILALANEMKSKITTDSVAEGVSSSQQSLSYYNKKHKEKPFYVLSPFETE
jgi:hypothetical protein